MPNGGAHDFRVNVRDLRAAGDNAASLGDGMVVDGDGLTASAGAVGGGLGGFALTGALEGSARAWQHKHDSLVRRLRVAARNLRAAADNYENADASGQAAFRAVGGGPAAQPRR